jgi:excinuclease ABC subunit B
MPAAKIVEQVIRPTGLVDPEIEVHSAQGQVPHLLEQIKARRKRRARSRDHPHQAPGRGFIAYIQEAGIRGRYLHSEIQTIERVEILNDLRKGEFDVLVGINLFAKGWICRKFRWWRFSTPTRPGFPAERNVADPDHRPRRAKRERQSDPLRRRDHARDAGGHGRNQPPPQVADPNTTPTTASRRRPSSAPSAAASNPSKGPPTAAEAVKQNEQQLDQTELIRC